LRMIFRIFGTYYALLNKARYQRVIVGELAKIALVQEVEAAVSDVCIIKMRSNQREGGQGRAHSAKKRILKCVLLDADVGLREAVNQALLRILLGIACAVNFNDRVHSDSTGVLTAFGATHAVRNHCQSAQTLELGIVLGLPIAKAVLIILTLAADVAQAGKFQPWSYLHNACSVLAQAKQ